jgi:RHS repeat-associated protein
VVGLTDASGDLVESYVYDPYGNAYIWFGPIDDGEPDVVSTDPTYDGLLTPSAYGNPYGFTGHRFSAAGLYETPFRAYSPTLGRWLQRDPLGYVDGPNLYAYVIGKPLIYLDPYGDVLDIVTDTYFIIVDVKDYVAGIKTQVEFIIGKEGVSWGDSKQAAKKAQAAAAGLVVDATAAALPVVPNPKTAKLAMDVADAANDARKLKKGSKAAESIQEHHILSKKVQDALDRHPNLKGKFKRNDKGLTTEGKQKGYERWHRDLDDEAADWLDRNPQATEEEFIEWLQERYNKPDLKERFPKTEIPSRDEETKPCE